MPPDPAFSQHPHRLRLEWGPPGATQAAARGDVVVIIDTLSFSSATVTAVRHGAHILPCSPDDAPAQLSLHPHATLALPRDQVPSHGPYSLSPLTYLNLPPDTHIILPSPNGATAARCAAAGSPHVLAACLLNATAAAAHLTRLLTTNPSLNATLIPAGERWTLPPDEGSLRFALEDYLAAGAILSALPDTFDRSPESQLCQSAYRATPPADLPTLLHTCASGRELTSRGHSADVTHAARLDLYPTVPTLRNGWFTRA